LTVADALSTSEADILHLQGDFDSADVRRSKAIGFWRGRPWPGSQLSIPTRAADQRFLECHRVPCCTLRRRHRGLS
jgi:hypothetical protein